MGSILTVKKSYDHLIASLPANAREYVALRAKGVLPRQAAQQLQLTNAAETAERWENDPTVRQAIEYSVRMLAYDTQITREDVLMGLQDAVRMSATASELVQAWREIGKIVGAYQPQRVEHTHTLTQEKLVEMSDAELAKVAAIDAEFVELSTEDEDE